MKGFIEQNKYVVAIIIGATIIAAAIYTSKSTSPSQLQDNENSGSTGKFSIPAGSDCFIKGNINTKGEKIYHLPGCGSYDQTVINESAGEKWFCSESAAITAGWRKAR